jgi:hypothetical protein
MSASQDPVARLNQVLSDVLDVVQDVKQALRKVPGTHALHAELDLLFDELRRWAGLLMARDEALGVSVLASMPSVAGRTPPNLWPGAVTDDEVRRVVGEHLDEVARHVAVAMAEQEDGESRAALAEVARGLAAHRLLLDER